MAWWYELRGDDNRLVETRRGFKTKKEAEKEAQRATQMIESFAAGKPEDLTVVTGTDA
jgi:Arm domain-containing DNA-binding protein